MEGVLFGDSPIAYKPEGWGEFGARGVTTAFSGAWGLIAQAAGNAVMAAIETKDLHQRVADTVPTLMRSIRESGKESAKARQWATAQPSAMETQRFERKYAEAKAECVEAFRDLLKAYAKTGVAASVLKGLSGISSDTIDEVATNLLPLMDRVMNDEFILEMTSSALGLPATTV